MRKLGIIGGHELVVDRALLRTYQPRRRAAPGRPAQRPRWSIESLDFAAYRGDGACRATGTALPRSRSMPPSGSRRAARRACSSPRNTGHKVLSTRSPRTFDVPMLHIGDATADRLVADGRTRVALLGTRFTMTEPFIRSRLEARGITLVADRAGWIARGRPDHLRGARRRAASSATASASSRP